MNNHYMAGSEKITTGFVDSGTTFTYVNAHLYNIIQKHFEWFCNLDKENHCKGDMDFSRRGYLCFSYDEEQFKDGPKAYFQSFPILRILVEREGGASRDDEYSLDWYPSEYLYRLEDSKYCVALDTSS